MTHVLPPIAPTLWPSLWIIASALSAVAILVTAFQLERRGITATTTNDIDARAPFDPHSSPLDELLRELD